MPFGRFDCIVCCHDLTNQKQPSSPRRDVASYLECIKPHVFKFNSYEYNLIFSGNTVVMLSCLTGEGCLHVATRCLPLPALENEQ